ncbi:MAG: MauE/DoxX family redox-associated membrane protein [Candidatus Marinimicrobia bacterium]|nr:MauE/DoxX family redox-associated membrane protein [Candidatus Neomarinimicrobiota bacterium]
MNKLHPWLIVLIRILLGVIFIYASCDKILDPGKFARDIANYHIIPMGFENLIALIIPWLELFIGIGLVAGLMVDGASIISGGLMALFILFIFQATLRGFNIECGCGLKEGEMVGWNKILENLVFLGASYLVWQRQKKLFELFPKTPLSD